MADTGDEAPNAQFVSTGDQAASIADYRGKKLVLYFYPKDDTSGCTREAQDFTALLPDFASAATEVVGISKDSLKAHDKFAGKYDLRHALGSDESGAVCDAFGVWVEKSMYGRKYMGIERATFLINTDGCIARVWRKVKVPGHAAEVLAAAQSL